MIFDEASDSSDELQNLVRIKYQTMTHDLISTHALIDK